MSESKKVKATLSIALTESELKDTSTKAIKLMQELDDLEEKYKVVKREWNAKVKDKKLEARTFCRESISRSREREVECKQHFCLEVKQKWYMYKGKEYDRENLSDYEVERIKQGALFGDGANLPVSADAAVEHSDADDNNLQAPPLTSVN